MSIWGHRDSESPAEERPGAEAQDAQDAREPAAGHQDLEPIPARTGVVVDGESAVKDPALTGPGGTQTGPAGAQSGPGGTQTGQAGAQSGPGGTQTGQAGAQSGPGGAQTRSGGESAGPTAAGVPEPTVAVAREPAVNEAKQSAATAQEPPGGVSPQRWSEILVGFVDDPRGSVKMAADAVDEAVDAFVNSVRDRQRDLESTWQGDQADTEQLRTALREYRRLGQRVQQLDLGEKLSG